MKLRQIFKTIFILCFIVSATLIHIAVLKEDEHLFTGAFFGWVLSAVGVSMTLFLNKQIN